MMTLIGMEWLFAALILVVFTNRYVFGTLLRLFDKRTVPGYVSEPDVWPTVTIIVPVFNEGSHILKTAQSFAKLDYPREHLSIVFVDDCSTDDSFKYLTQVANTWSCVKVRQNSQNMGKRLGIKSVVLNVDTELILSVDSDVIVESDALKNLVRHMLATKVDAVGGCVYVSNPNETWLTKMQAVKYWVGYHFLKNLENAFNHVMCLSGCMTLYKRTALLTVDKELENRAFLGDDVKYGEDRFLTRKLVERGFKTRLCFDAKCFTKAPPKIPGYLNQQLRWRRSNAIDFITALPHLNKFHPLVLVHYICLNFLLFFYPLFLVSQVMRLGFVIPMIEHTLVVTIFAIAYEFYKPKLPKFSHTSGIWFLAIIIVFPIMYLTMTPLGLATLGTTSWETRIGPKKKYVQAEEEGAWMNIPREGYLPNVEKKSGF